MPSIFTLSSLFLGYLAIMQILNRNFETAVYLVTGSVILDGFDGTVARLTKTESGFGVQLDSLVDAVTFGMVTAVMIYIWGFQGGMYSQVGKVIGFIFLSAGIIRLARFNVLKEAETDVTNVFIGLPIPLGALSIASVFLIRQKTLVERTDIILFSVFVILVAILMISNIKYKTVKRLRSKNNLLILFGLAVSIALLINFPNETIPSMSFLYLVSPLFFFVVDKVRKTPEADVTTSSALSIETSDEEDE
ncbi:MAG: CDP-diacylglycerol--serine O-phosphatidyltransferase [bacterium]|nr:CDP-diacylglycerol--serine O-phosphatidyltransferase [bacterium]